MTIFVDPTSGLDVGDCILKDKTIGLADSNFVLHNTEFLQSE